jgi:mannose-6-phosphate isomerase-like protein (cupin superfamily)
MSVDLYQPFTNPITQETFRCLTSNEEVYETEWIVGPGGYVPFEHVHLNQEEVFHVRRGELRLLIAGREQIAAAGQTVRVPRGLRQTGSNRGAGVLECVLEYRPGLDTFKVFQCFAGLTLDGDMGRRGLVNPFKMMYFLRKMNARAIARPAFLPGPLFRVFMEIFFVVGSTCGWERLYLKYTR